MTRYLKTKLDDDLEVLVETLDTGVADVDPTLLPRGVPAAGSSIVQDKAAQLESAVKVAKWARWERSSTERRSPQ